MNPIPFNPYIVGNPIKTKEMFFGREDDFLFVSRKIGEARSNQILVLCGDRRSGKTSILFQILGGRLGESFLPVLVDMQMLVGMKGDDEFFLSVLKIACEDLKLPSLSLENVPAAQGQSTVGALFESFFRIVEEHFPDRIVLFLLDEYELIETKIKDGSLSDSSIHYLGGILESPHRISFVFTGSTNLEDRKVEYWRTLLGKSIYRKISYLSQKDTFRLITEPLKGCVEYPEAVVSAIYRLTGGQPFYTQVICQNMVDLLLEEGRNNPTMEDLERVVADIIDNPLPQMIYSWNNLADWSRLTLSSLSSLLEDSHKWAGGPQILHFLKDNRIVAPFKKERIHILLDDAYHREFLEKKGTDDYRFKVDLFRRWIKREHSIWKVAKEAGLGFLKPRKLAVIGLSVIVPLALAAFIWFYLIPRLSGSGKRLASEPATPAATVAPPATEVVTPKVAEVKNLRLTANSGPFQVVIDGDQRLTSQGLGDGKTITVSSIKKGAHSFRFSNPASTEKTIEKTAEIVSDNQTLEVSFTIPPVAEKAPEKVAAVLEEKASEKTATTSEEKPVEKETPVEEEAKVFVIRLPPTGQSVSYAKGDDGDLKTGVQGQYYRRFGDNGDLTVTDQLTGLMWEKYPAEAEDVTRSLKTWSAALTYSEELTLGGYLDWRLPNVRELETFLNYGERDQMDWLNNSGFKVKQKSYWTSTTSAVDTSSAYILNLRLYSLHPSWMMNTTLDSKTNRNAVWAVRKAQPGILISNAQPPKTGQDKSYAKGDDGALKRGISWPNPRFVDNGNGTITDTLTNLTWEKKPVETRRSWTDALAYSNDLSLGGYTDWRLPNEVELDSIFNYGARDPLDWLNTQGFEFTEKVFWSSTTFAPDTTLAWAVNLRMSEDVLSPRWLYLKSSLNAVLAVRSGP